MLYLYVTFNHVGNMLNMDSSCAGGNVSPSDMSGSSSHTSPQPATCPMDEHMTSTGGGNISNVWDIMN